MPKVKIFQYIESLDAFIVTDEYKRMADTLGLTEWNPMIRKNELRVSGQSYNSDIILLKPELKNLFVAVLFSLRSEI
jgi:hypothetical protein